MTDNSSEPAPQGRAPVHRHQSWFPVKVKLEPLDEPEPAPAPAAVASTTSAAGAEAAGTEVQRRPAPVHRHQPWGVQTVKLEPLDEPVPAAAASTIPAAGADAAGAEDCVTLQEPKTVTWSPWIPTSLMLGPSTTLPAPSQRSGVPDRPRKGHGISPAPRPLTCQRTPTSVICLYNAT